MKPAVSIATATAAGDSVAGRAIDAARAMEASVQGCGLDRVGLRGGLFYGPGTGLDDDPVGLSR